MVVVIQETYKLIAEVKHILTDEEYESFKKMSTSERFDFVSREIVGMYQKEKGQVN